MQPSALFCRTQESLQRSRGAAATLENVRAVASAAAHAWGKEAALAERRESRLSRAIVEQATGCGAEPSAWDRSFSENPDRGFAAGTTPPGAATPR
jgi:hypothetical protein